MFGQSELGEEAGLDAKAADEGPKGLRGVIRGAAGDRLLACALGTAFFLEWLPLVEAAVSADWASGFVAIVPFCAFFMTAAATALFANGLLEGADLPARRLAFAAVATAAAGSLVGAFGGTGALAETAALGALGCSSTLGCLLWQEGASQRGPATFALGVTGGLLAWSLVGMAALRAGTGAVCLASALGGAVSALASLRCLGASPRGARPGALARPSAPGASVALPGQAAAWQAPGARAASSQAPSKLLQITAARLSARYVGAFFCLGLLTAAMLTLFAMGLPDPGLGPIAAGLPAGALALAAIVAIGWAVNREPSFVHSFELTFFVALVAFFPFYPGSEFNQRLSLFLGALWGVVLAGSALLVSREVRQACAPAGRDPVGPGVASLFMGLAFGAGAAALLLSSPWFTGLARGAYPRVMLATTMGACAILLAYISTNILLRRSLLREARLIAQGKFPTLVQAEGTGARQAWPSAPETAGGAADVHAAADTPGAADGIEARCRQIALAYGCTPREHDLLVVLARGNSMARAQEELVISEGTAITHRRNLYRKLGVSSKQELIDFVRDWPQQG